MQCASTLHVAWLVRENAPCAVHCSLVKPGVSKHLQMPVLAAVKSKSFVFVISFTQKKWGKEQKIKENWILANVNYCSNWLENKKRKKNSLCHILIHEDCFPSGGALILFVLFKKTSWFVHSEGKCVFKPPNLL